MTDPKPLTPEEVNALAGELFTVPYPQPEILERLIATIREAWAERDTREQFRREHQLEHMRQTERAETAEAELAEAQEQANMQAELTEHWQKADAEARALLSDVREACLFDDDDGIIGVTTDPHIDERLFDKICAALNPEPADG